MTQTPLERFKAELKSFAEGERKGIRNPFVIVPIKPELEDLVTDRFEEWSEEVSHSSNDLEVDEVRLNELLPRTEAFRIVRNFSSSDKEGIRDTLSENLSSQIVEEIIEEVGRDEVGKQNQIILLLNLGSLYPFTRASEILDELDRQNVKATIGIPFPGEVIAGKLSFYGEESRHYYPAHRIDEQITEEDLQ